MPQDVCLKLYVGTPEDDGRDFLYLDLEIPSREVPLWESKEELGDCSGQDFLKVLSDALNEAFLYMKYLGLKLKLDKETIAEMSEDFSEKDSREIKELLKEALS